jgi:hypothetical protein
MNHAIPWQVVKFRWDWFQPLYLTIIFKKFKGSGLVHILISFSSFFWVSIREYVFLKSFEKIIKCVNDLKIFFGLKKNEVTLGCSEESQFTWKWQSRPHLAQNLLILVVTVIKPGLI